MDDTEIDLRRILGILRRRLKLIVAISATTLVLSLIASTVITPIYVATTLVAFDPEQKNLLDPQIGNMSGSTDNARIEGEIELLRSDTLLLKVIADQDLLTDNAGLTPQGLRTRVAGWLGLGEPDTSTQADRLETALANLHRAISVQRRGLTYLIAVQARSADPAKSASLANAVAQSYIAAQVDSKVDSLLASRDVVQSRLLDAREEIIASEAQFNAFLRQSLSRIAQNDGDGKLKPITDQLDRLANERQIANDMADLVSTSLKNDDWDKLSTLLASAGSGVLIEQRHALATEVAAVTNSSPTLTALQGNLEQLDSQLALSANSALSDLKTQIEDIDIRQRLLQDELRAFVMQSDLPADLLTGMYDLQSRSNFAREQYQTLVARSLELQNQSNLQIADSRIVSPALVPAAPSSPNRSLFLALGLLGGLALGVATAVIYESMVGGFMSEEQIEASLNTRVAATIPRLKLSTSDDTLADMVITAPLSSFAEAMRRARMTIDQTARHSAGLGCIAMVTSAAPSEGKSTVALALARSYALSGRHTLLIDCDLRQPGIAEELAMAPQAGLLEILDAPNAQGQIRNSLRHESDTGLAMILGAEGTDRPMDLLLAGTAFERLLSEARNNFDIVVLDTPAIGPVVDALYVAPLADIVVMVTRWASTSQRETKQALASLNEAKASKARIVSVLNDKAGKLPKRSKRQPRYYETDYA